MISKYDIIFEDFSIKMNPELYVLSEGKLKDKWNALANASTKKALDEFIKRKNYIGARDELGRNKMYLTQFLKRLQLN
jgi:hypothetical protein